MSKPIVFFLLCLLITSCKSKEQHIIDEAIDIQGGKAYEKFRVQFTFRGIDYDFERDGGLFVYQRIQHDSLGNEIKDVLTNSSFERRIDGEKVAVADSMARKYENSVNSVAYFFLLPYGLNDPAVNKTYEKEIVIKGQKYHQIKIWFNKEGGGEDHQDIFKFWFNDHTKKLDFLAYSYETDGGGVRFREAIEVKKIGSFLFPNYNNYGYEDQNFPLDDLPKDFQSGKLPFLSKIENENITLVE